MTSHNASEALAGQVVLVTGASQGIGRATALRLAEAGARLALVARRPAPLEALANQLNGWSFPCDVRDPEALERVAQDLRAVAGREPDVVVTAAGVFNLSPVTELTDQELALNLDVNLKGGILTVRQFLPGMLERGAGTVVQVGSVAGRKAFPGNGAYSASKFGIRGFHEVLLQELHGTGVRATLLEPAATDTPIWDPMDPDTTPELPDRAVMLDPAEVAEAVHFVATRPHGVQIPFLPVERG